ncbi:unnamed protein product [Debaryomyces tyrocola]|nr:unnamed protein product [Debaryomyces tyrocola]
MTKQRNELFPRLGSCVEDTLADMIKKTVNDNIQNIVQQTIESLNQNPPEWFTREISGLNTKIDACSDEIKGLKRGFKDLKGDFADFKGDFADLKGDFADLKGDMDSGFKMSEYRHACLYNMVRRMNGSSAVPVPFLNVEAMLDELSPIGSVEDIDSLSKQECQTYLRAYNVEFHPNESVKLKEKLRDAIGLAVGHDVGFLFGNFNSC